VGVTLKHREDGITFAFVEYDSGKSAQQAVDEYLIFLFLVIF
jgi:hypothetical protein